MSGDVFLDGLRADVPEIQTRFRRLLAEEIRVEEERRRRIERYWDAMPEHLWNHPTVLRIAAHVGTRVPTEHEWTEFRSELAALASDEGPEDEWS